MRIAIIDDNILAGIGLRNILEDIMPAADVMLYHDTTELSDSTKLHQYAHFFVSSRIYFSNTDIFQQVSKKTIILTNGETTIRGMHTINVCQEEKRLIHDFIAMHRVGHSTNNREKTRATSLLSPREIQVVILLCKGLINKEIGEKLNISLTTVMTHRKNIIAKLRAKSLADIIIYAVLNGYINIEEL